MKEPQIHPKHRLVPWQAWGGVIAALTVACDPVPAGMANESDSDTASDSAGDIESEGVASSSADDALAPHPDPHSAATDGADYGGHHVEVGECGSLPNCVDDIPMSGTVSPLFAEVDHAVRAFMKSQCVGSGVLAVSYKGRRVYKRGFGRMEGSSMAELPAHCSNDEFKDGAVVLPDTEVNVGSVSKLLPAMMVRELIQARIDEVESQGIVPVGTYEDPTAVLLLDPVLEILPPKLLQYFDSSRADFQCPPVAITDDDFSCLRVDGCNGTAPDVRWQNVTVADLLAHTSGLPRSGPQLTDTIPDIPLLRGLDTWAEFFVEHAAVKGSFADSTAFEAARKYLATETSSDVADVFFVNPWELNPGKDGHPIDETLVRLAGRCLENSPGGRTQDDLSMTNSDIEGGTVQYSNTGYVLLERIVAHLDSTGRFAAIESPTELNTGLHDFLSAEGMSEGVMHDSAMFPVHRYLPWTGPQRREFQADQMTYAPMRTPKVRPFCIWDGEACSFDPWFDTPALRLPADFATSGLTFDPISSAVVPTKGPPLVPFEREWPVLAAGTGALAMEAPALLKLMSTYFIGRNDVHTGRPLDGCTDCNTFGWKDGGAGGTRAFAEMMVAGDASGALPPLDGAGRLTVEPFPSAWQTATWADRDEVNFVVSIQQSADEIAGPQLYSQLEHAVRYGLSRVDWVAVDAMINRQRLNVVGMGISNSGSAYYWFEDDHKTSHAGLPAGYHLLPETKPVTPPGDPGGPAKYDLPSTRIGSDVVAVAVANNDRVYGWYNDGHRSGGNSWDLGANVPTHTYTVPTGYTFNDIVGVGISSGNTTWSWFENGQVGRGTSWALGSKSMHAYELPPGQTADQIAGMAINKANDHTFTMFKDGSVAEGDFLDLDCWGYEPGGVAGMGMLNGDTSIWYRTGYRKDLVGTPADNQETPTIAQTSDYYLLPDGYDYTEVIGVAQPDVNSARMWFDDGSRAHEWPSGNFEDYAPPGSITFPVGANAGLARGIAMAGTGSAYSWFNTSNWAMGSVDDLASVGQWAPYDTPGGQSEFSIEAVAIDTGAEGTGRSWTLYSDGAVSSGWPWDLDVDYWPAPVPVH